MRQRAGALLLCLCIVTAPACGAPPDGNAGNAGDAGNAGNAGDAGNVENAEGAANAQAAQPPQPAAAEKPGSPQEGIAARVNGAPINGTEVSTAVANFMSERGMGPDTPKERQDEIYKVVLDGLIGTELLYQRARALSIDATPASVDEAIALTRKQMGDTEYDAELARRNIDAAGARELARKNLTVQRLIQETILTSVSVTEPEISKYYDDHQKDIAQPESAEVSHILIRSASGDPEEKKAQARVRGEEALARIRKGDDFATVAMEVSEDKNSAARGGSLGEVRKGRTVSAFDDAAFKLQPGQMSDLVESAFGYHIIKVTGRKPARTPTLTETHDRIAQILRGRASEAAIEKAVTDLRASAKVEIY